MLLSRLFKKAFAVDKWILLHVRKKLLNAAVRLVNAVLPDRQPLYPQTRLLEDVYAKMHRAYRVEVYCGRFDDVPHQTLKTLRDRHFLNVLDLSRKVLIYLGDTDRYYRQWLGLFFLLIHDAVEEQQQSMLFEEFLASARAQWDFNMCGSFPKEYFDAHKRDFQEIMLTNSLYNLCAKRYETLIPRVARKKLEER
jgi:hypothetical protein